MPLPQQVIDRLGRSSPSTPGWSFGMLTFSGGIFLLVALIYGGLVFGYEPYIDSQIADLNTQIATLGKAISTNDQQKFITSYSEVVNLKTVLNNHVILSQFFDWLQKNTEANISFSRMTFSSGNQIAFTGSGKTEADVNQQAIIFEMDPAVTKTQFSNVSYSDTDHTWSFSAIITVNPAMLLRMQK